jgi:molybdopterin-binding protein
MNRIQAKITHIQSVENLNILTFESQNTKLTMMSLELSPMLSVGSEVILTSKSTAIAIAKEPNTELSHANQLRVRISSIELGELLCSLELKFYSFVIESIITSEAAQRMQLQVGMDVIALIKANDLSLEKII